MINIGIIGCGYWGSNLVRVFSQLEQCRLHTCCDFDESKLNKMKKLYPTINLSKEPQEIFQNTEIDAVVISTPVSTHFNLAKSALLSGKHVLIEKPMTSNSEEAKALVQLAKEQNKKIMVDHTFEFEPGVRKMKKIVESGELGDIYYITANWLNLGIIQPDVNVIFDLAPHIFSIINYVVGQEPISVSSSGESYVNNKIGLEEMASVKIKYPNKITALMNLSWLEPYKTRKLIIVGSKKMLVFDLLQPQEQIKIFDKGADMNSLENKISYRSGDVYSPNISPVEPLGEAAKHFVSCIVEDKAPLTSGEKGLSVVKLLESSNLSLINNGGEVKL